MQNVEFKQVGVVGVDSGQVMVCDPCYIDSEWEEEELNILPRFDDKPGGAPFTFGPAKHSFSYSKIVYEKDHAHLPYAQMHYKHGHPGVAVAVDTGFGDGSYPVYAMFSNEPDCTGRVMGLFIDFGVLDYGCNQHDAVKAAKALFEAAR